MNALRTATVHRAWAADLDTTTLYALLKLRVDVFVVEQECAYPELDGRDLEPRTRHYWLGGTDTTGRPGPILGTLRLLKEPDGDYRIGRVAVVADGRGQGLGKRLLEAVLAEVRDGGCVLDAQTPLADLYRPYGFEVNGPEFVEDGIPHIPMRRAPR